MSSIAKKVKKLNLSILTIYMLGLVIIGLASVFVIEAFAIAVVDDSVVEEYSVIDVIEPRLYSVEQTKLENNNIEVYSVNAEVNEIKQEETKEEVSQYTVKTVEIPTWTEDERAWIIYDKKSDLVNSKTVKEADVRIVEPRYNEDGKLVVKSAAEAMCLDIRTKSNWTAEDFYGMLNEEMYNLVPLAIEMEKQLGVNALYIISVGANETGWGKYMAGDNNYFNWTHDGVYHFDFATVDEFNEFSLDRYNRYYTEESFFTDKLGFEPKYITPEVVNVRYAIDSSGIVNWQWSNTVTQIMSELSSQLV